MVIAELRRSTYPWWRHAYTRRFLRVTFTELQTTPSGSSSGLLFQTGSGMNNPYTTAHELGHVVDAWALDWEARQMFTNRYCGHVPQHPWRRRPDEWAWALGEAFANTYAWAFHGQGHPGLAHEFPIEHRDWFVDWILSR